MLNRVIFEKVHLKNFRCHEDIELSFPTGKLVAITGGNGHGKSSILMGLCAGLYGETSEGIRFPDLVNKKINKNLEIHIHFKIDSQQYTIHRYYQHKKFKNALYLYKGDEDISKKTTTDTYTFIEDLVCPKKVFVNVVYFGQQIKDFFTALTDSKQKEIFNSILQLEEFKIYYNNTNIKLQKAEAEVEKIKTEIAKFEAMIPIQERQVDEYTKRFEKEEKERKENLEKIKQVIEETNQNIKKVETEILNLQYDPEKYQDILQDVASLMTKITSVKNDINNIVTNVSKEFLVAENSLKDNAKSKLSNIRDSISRDAIDQEKEKQLQIQKVIYTTNEIKTKLVNDVNSVKDELAKNIKDFQSELAFIQTELYNLQNKFSCFDLEQQRDTTIASIKKKCDLCEVSITSCNNEIKKSNIELKDKKDKLYKVENSTNNAICYVCGQKIKDKKHVETLRKQLLDDIKHLEESIKSNNQIIEEKTKDIEDFNKKIADLKRSFLIQIQERKTKMINEQSGLNRKKDLIELNISELENTANDKIDKLKSEADHAVDELNDKVCKLNNDIQTIKESSKKVFEENKDRITNDLLKKLNEQNIKKEQFIAKKRQELILKQSKLEEELQICQSNKLRYEEIKTQYEKLQLQKQDFLSSIKFRRDVFDKLQSSSLDTTNLDNIKKELTSSKESLAKQTLAFKDISNNIDILSFWKEAFSDRGIPSMLIDSAIPFMNKVVKEELEKIAPGKFIVSFDTISETKSGDIRERFKVNVLNTYTGADNHNLLSGGEKRQIDVACMRALRLLCENLYGKSYNITLLDEVLDSLDSENASLFCQNLKMLAADQNITLITHSLLQDAECDQVLRM